MLRIRQLKHEIEKLEKRVNHLEIVEGLLKDIVATAPIEWGNAQGYADELYLL